MLTVLRRRGGCTTSTVHRTAERASRRDFVFVTCGTLCGSG